MISRRTLLAALPAAPGLTPKVHADQLAARLTDLRPVRDPRLPEAVLDNLERRAQETLAAIHHASTASAADAQRAGLRRRLEESLGFRRLPWPPSVRAEVKGTLKRDGYTVEKIVYETLPGTRVPAHLYLPAALSGRAPAVLFYTGHWWADSKARPDFQAFSINMARLGFAVLTWDAFGQGERGISNRDHRRTEALLCGIAQQGFAEYETQCALTYLLTRPEVDPERIGMTGASGGGYNTWMTAALDDRIKAAVPVVGTSEFYQQIHVCRPLDWYHANEHCHFVPGLIRYANNHELLAMAAPKPVLIIAASEDQSFPVSGVREVHGYATELYRSYGAPEKTALYVDESTGHGYQRKKREAAYGWFLRWLKNSGTSAPVPEPETETLRWDSAELRCFPPGKNEAAGRGMVEAVRRIAVRGSWRKPLPDLESILGKLPPAPMRAAIGEGPLRRLLIPSEKGITIPGFLARPTGAHRGVLVGVCDNGKEALASDAVIDSALACGWAVCGIDPRGIGELATGLDGWTAAVSLLLSENFVWRQAFDIGAAMRTFEGPVHLYARGHNASLAAAYAVAQQRRNPQFTAYVLRDGFVTFRSFFDRPKSLAQSFALQSEEHFRNAVYDREIPFSYFVPDVLGKFDIGSLMASSKARGLIVNPINGDWERMTERDAAAHVPAPVLCTDVPETAIGDFLFSYR